jgi:hypothetical protein
MGGIAAEDWVIPDVITCRGTVLAKPSPPQPSVVNGPWKSDRLLTVKHMVSSERSPLFCGLISHASNSDRRDPCILMTSVRSPESGMPGHRTAPLWTETQEERGYRFYWVILHFLLDIINLPNQSRYLLLEDLFPFLCLPVQSCAVILSAIYSTQRKIPWWHWNVSPWKHAHLKTSTSPCTSSNILCLRLE